MGHATKHMRNNFTSTFSRTANLRLRCSATVFLTSAGMGRTAESLPLQPSPPLPTADDDSGCCCCCCCCCAPDVKGALPAPPHASAAAAGADDEGCLMARMASRKRPILFDKAWNQHPPLDCTTNQHYISMPTHVRTQAMTQGQCCSHTRSWCVRRRAPQHVSANWRVSCFMFNSCCVGRSIDQLVGPSLRAGGSSQSQVLLTGSDSHSRQSSRQGSGKARVSTSGGCPREGRW